MTSLAACATALLFASAPDAPPSSRPSQAKVVVLEIEGAIQPASLRYLERGLRHADQAGAELVLLRLDTPGGLLTSLRDMTAAITGSRVPVAVFVAPAGARAASAGFFLLMAADIAAMAPGTNAGAAHPVALGGQNAGDGAEDAKAEQDAAALVRSLAQQRGRSVEWAERAVTESRSYSEQEARRHGLVEIIAGDEGELLRRLNGVEVERFQGGRQALALASPQIERLALTPAERLLMVIADPQVAYLLLMLGLLGLLFELSAPGTVVPGVVGSISLLLALYGLSVLPVNWVGALLIALGIALLVAEAFVTSYGLLALAGIAGFVLGSLLLIDVKGGVLGIGLGLVVPAALVMAGVTLVLLERAVRARAAPGRTGLEGMVGELGEVVAPIEGGSSQGKVFVHGEYWFATAEAPLADGTQVRVEAIEGGALRVAAAEPRPIGG